MLKRALFAGAALVIGATYMQGAATPALAGPNIKPKVNVAPKPRIRIVKPKVRIKIRPQRLPREMQEKKTTDPTKLQARKVAPPAGNVIAGQTPDFAGNIKRFSELAQIGAFREHIEGILDMLNIAGLDGSLGVPGLIGEDGQNNDGSGGKLGGGFGAAPSPGDAVGGIASSDPSMMSPWSRGSGRASNFATRSTGWYDSPEHGAGTRSRTQETLNFGTNKLLRETTTVDGDGNEVNYETNIHNMSRSRYRRAGIEPKPGSDEIGSGDTNKPDSGNTDKPDSGDKGKPKDIAKQQDPYADGGVVVWIPPSCGSAACNGIRDYLKNPQGTIGQIIGKGTRVHGDREGDPNTGTMRLEIDQHGLVVSYGADSGPAFSRKGRPRYTGPTRIQSD